ncbi:MAG TPA: putative DNA binding domain-containing protein [Candidatus Hydrogenedens sp.]|nr:putative DNA binding domain-containing protein [Candidatus Hydrogenedens sp.]
MNEIDILELIKQGEGHHLEFKREDENNPDFAKTIAAFANTDGGKILIGVDDNGDIIGMSNPDKFMSRLDDIAYNKCNPPITILQEVCSIQNKEIIVVSIPKGIQRPYMTNGKFYIRSSNRVREASREEILRLFQRNESLFYDELPVARASLSDIEFHKVYNFFENYINFKVNENDINYYLQNFSIINEEDIPTVAGLLFFGKNPQKYLKEARIVCSYIPGNDISLEPADLKSIGGTIPDMIEDSERFINLYLIERHKIKDFEPELYPELPLAAIRELVINALAHRDYTIAAPVRIIIFLDRIEIHSPGTLPNTVTIDKIKVGGAHVLRNSTIYTLLYKFRFVTDLGSGIRRACELVKNKINKEVDFKQTDSEFTVIVPRNINQ